MNSHLPECYVTEHSYPCICARLRAAQERGTARAYDQGVNDEQDRWGQRAKNFLEYDDRVAYDVIMFVLNEGTE